MGGERRNHPKKPNRRFGGERQRSSRYRSSLGEAEWCTRTNVIDVVEKFRRTAIMLIPKANRKLIYENLFKDGVLVAKKDFNAPKHTDLDVPNLQVIKALQSLNSRGYVKTQFSWQYYYYSLTNEGIEYLREYLHLPAEIVPATFKKTATPSGVRPSGREGPRDGARAPRGGQDDYRRRGEEGGKKEGASGDFRPEFRGGFGRGARTSAQ